MDHKIKEIIERLAEIAVEKDSFNLTEKIDNKHVIVRERETHSFVDASDVIGRDKDKEEIIKLLMSPSDDGDNIPVIPIVGIGGLGKTALAKLVYNDEMISRHFELKIWVCVSEEFDLNKWITKIVNSATKQNYSNLDLKQMQEILRGILGGKKYLLILDDVWNEAREKRIALKALLVGGTYGSKILVTTRNYRVASIMGTMPEYSLGGLSNEESLSLFIKCAFPAGQEKRHPNLINIGKEIVKKCGGVPLAIRSLGSSLYSSTYERDWENVRDNEIWKLEQMENEVFRPLRLSYDRLPFCLKQCFAYCSVFPKDYPFSSNQIVQFWMAHGLLNSLEENQDLENIGASYLKESISRSFFQDVAHEKYYDEYDFKMHDLASLLMKTECSILKSRNQVCPKSVRHLAFANVDQPKIYFPIFLSGVGHVRTILFTFIGEGPSQSFLKSMISKFPFLRLMHLGDSNIETVPKKLGNLKHLRYLDLGNNKIKTLPNSICKLHYLECLYVDGCVELEELPKNIKYLVSLRVLWLTVKINCLSKNQIGCLNSLRDLFIFGCHKLKYLFEDIGRLKSLRRLIIADCSCLLCLPYGIKNLSSLENLQLINCERLNLDMLTGSELGVNNRQDLNSERPHLQLLVVRGLPELVELPQWLLQLSTDSLQKLFIRDCSLFKALPHPMQNLQSLQYLHIRYCSNLSSLPEDMHRLTTLREIRIIDCPTLSERCEKEKGEDWPKIADIPKIWLDDRWIKLSNY